MVEPLWRWDELIAATGGVAEGAAADGATGVSIDTRTLRKGDLFVALRGDTQDGHVYVSKAFEKGAAAALVAREFVTPAGAGPLVRVEDTLRGLERLGVAARARLSAEARVIAVTGSVGKTSTKEMLRVCLASVDPRTHASDKSYNNHWGVPLTLARMPRDTRFGVFEIGMNHAGEITPLTKMVRPHVAIITTVGPVHLGHFKSVEEIADAKAEIFAGLEAPPSNAATVPSPQPSPQRGDGAKSSAAHASIVPSPRRGEGQDEGAAVLPADNEHFERLKAAAIAKGASVRSFGGNRGDIRLQVLGTNQNMPTSEVRAEGGGQRLNFVIGAIGLHHAINSLAVIAAVTALGFKPEDYLGALAKFSSAAGRGSRHRYVRNEAVITLVDESYNANPLSMDAALDALQKSTPSYSANSRRIAVLGDMRELGAESERLHRELVDSVEIAEIDLVFTCGPFMRFLYDGLKEPMRGAHAEKSEGLIAPLLAAIRPGDVIMIKGSLGTRMAPIVEAVKRHLEDWAGQKSASQPPTSS